MSSLTTVILAGGKGTRIRTLFPNIPKPMIPVLGQPFLYWLTAYFAGNGARKFVYSTGYLGEQIEAWCRDDSMPGLQRFVCPEEMPLGTGGGLMNCLEKCDDWVLATNGDSICIGGLSELLALNGQDDVDGGIIGIWSDDTSRYGRLDFGEDKILSGFREKSPGQGYINAGIYLFRKSVLVHLSSGSPASIEYDTIPALVSSGARLSVVALDHASFIDVGTPETVTRAKNFIIAHQEHFKWSTSSA